MSRPWTNERRRAGRIVAAAAGGLAVIGGLALAANALFGSGGVRTGSALSADGEGGIFQPLPLNTPLSLGVVRTRNVSDRSLELVSARVLRLDPDLELLGFSALPERPDAKGDLPPLTALEHPLPGAVPLPEFPPLPPAADEHPQVVVMFALGVKPGGAGKAVGVEVRYRQGGKLRQQVFRELVYVCSVPSLREDCPGVKPGIKDAMDLFGEFEDEVKGVSRRSPGQEQGAGSAR